MTGVEALIERRRRKPVYIETALVTEHTAERVALWCGGSWGHERDRGSDSYLELIVPNIEGNKKAHVNDYVVRKEDGRFHVMKQADMLEYEKMGVRGELVDHMGNEYPKAPTGASGISPKPSTPHYVPRGQYPVGE